jgi:hypothetical protein
VITQCLDMNVVKMFMTLPEVSRYSTEYGAEEPEFETDSRNLWLLYSTGKEYAGLINIHIETGTMAMFHPYILREFKSLYDVMSLEFGKWFLDNAPKELVKLNVAIPEIYKAAVDAAERCGMTREGVDRDSFLTENGACNRILLGITRKELMK